MTALTQGTGQKAGRLSFLQTNRMIYVVSGLALLVVVLAVWIAVSLVFLPTALVPASAPPADFSGARALTHLQVISSEPHTVGSAAQARVQAYLEQQITALGLTPVIQDATSALAKSNGVFASNPHNILVRIPGTNSTGAVAVMAHYDSQPNTPGASDNGTAVAGVLETMRALKAGPALRNDLIFVLTDAEEVDAQGAEAFFRQHPWAKEVRLLVNFEAAGDTGPSFLTELSPGNRGLVEGFIRAVPHPVAYSFLTQLLTLAPLGTDMTVFAENGVPSLSPMFGRHYATMYHSMLDNLGALDPGSVQHQGENALALARYFGNQDLAALNTREDAVFFSLVGGVVVEYPASLAVPLSLLAALLLAAAIVIGLLRRRLSIGGLLAGIGIGLVGILAPVILSALVWMGIVQLHPEFWRNLMGAPYQADLYLLGLVAVLLAANLVIFILARRRVSAAHLAVGALLIWLVPVLLTSLYLPGMSYLFAWPVLVTVLPVLALVLRPDPGRAAWGWMLALAAAAAVVILVVVPIVALLFLLLGFWFHTYRPETPIIAVSLLLTALMLQLMALQMDALVQRLAQARKWLAPGLAAAFAVLCLAAAGVTSAFSAGQPLQNGVWYEMSADGASSNGASQAAWYSYGTRPTDPWTAQFFNGATEPVALAAVYAALGDNPAAPANAFKGAAPAASLPAPLMTVLSDRTSGDVRTLSLHLSSPRLARGLRVQVSGAPVLAATVNGNRQADPAWAGRNEWYLRYYGLTAQGLDLVLEVKPGAELTLVVADQSDGLPTLPGVTYAPRQADMMPFAMAQEYMPYPETTSVYKTFTLH